MASANHDTGKMLAPTLARRFIPSLGGVIGSTIFLMVLINGDRLLLDADTGWHIRTGDYILDNMTVPQVDIFSNRKLGEPWIAHEWLSDVAFAAVHRIAGLNGVVVLSAGVIALTFMLLSRLLRFYRFNPLTITAVTVLAALTASIHWLARPHLFSFCLSVVWFSLLESLQASPAPKRSWLFPVLMVLWVNLHGGFLFGFALLAIYALGNVICFIFDQTSERESYKARTVALVKITLFCLMTAFVNPYGYDLLMFPFEQLASSTSLSSIAEWRSPNFHKFSYYEFYLLLFVAMILMVRQKTSVVSALIAIFVIHASLVSQRFIPYFAVFVAPIMGRQIDALYNVAISPHARKSFLKVVGSRLQKSVENLQRFDNGLDHYSFAAFLCMVALLIACNDGTVWGKKILDFHFKGDNYPIAAAEFLRNNPLPGKMFNFYSYGGYLIYTFYPDPRYRVFVDGRSIVDGEDYFTEFHRVNEATQHWKEVLKVYHVNWIIYPSTSWLSTLVLEGTDWKPIYADPVTNIFIKNIPENQSVIDRFSNAKPVL